MVYRGAKSNHQSGPIYSNEVGQFRLAKSPGGEVWLIAGVMRYRLSQLNSHYTSTPKTQQNTGFAWQSVVHSK